MRCRLILKTTESLARLDKALALVNQQSAASDQSDSRVEIKLKLLKDLRQGGLIAEADYQRQKQKLLDTAFEPVEVAAVEK